MFFACMANAATPAEILDWYKKEYPNMSIDGICNMIKSNIDDRKGNFLVFSKNSWSISESETALTECHNIRLATLTPGQAKRAIETESSRCNKLLYRAKMNFNSVQIAMGYKANAEAAFAKCDFELQAELAELRKVVADHEAEKVQRAADEKAQLDAKNEITELPNLPLAYYNKDQAQAYMAAMKKVAVEEVLNRSSFRPFPSAGKNGLTSSWTLNIKASRNVYAHNLSINCYQTIAGKEQKVDVRIGETNNNTFKGQLNVGSNHVKVDVWFVDDATFPVRDLIEKVRCTAKSGVDSQMFRNAK